MVAVSQDSDRLHHRAVSDNPNAIKEHKLHTSRLEPLQVHKPSEVKSGSKTLLRRKGASPIPTIVTHRECGRHKCKVKNDFNNKHAPVIWEVQINQLLETGDCNHSNTARILKPSNPRKTRVSLMQEQMKKIDKMERIDHATVFAASHVAGLRINMESLAEFSVKFFVTIAPKTLM